MTAEPPSLRVRLGWYVVTFLAALLFPIAGYRLDQVSLYAPLVHETNGIMFNDTLLIQPMVQATLEHGTHWKTARLGFPGYQLMHDFPVVDHFHFFWLWILGQITGSTILTFNLYYLLGYPLAALAMMAVLRHLGVSFIAASACGILFAALPYHQYRGENHYFLSAYYMVPITSLVMLWICAGRLPFFPLRSRDTLFTIIVMLITGSAGAYYAFFACALLATAGVYGVMMGHGWRALISSGLCIGVVFTSGVANHAPTFFYHAQWGKYTAPVDRPPEDSEYYALKITQLILPIDDHKLQKFAEFKSIYNSYLRPVQAYTERYSLGSVVGLVFVGLLVALVLPIRRREPFGALITLTGFAVVLGMVGGFGAIFNQTITPSVRCYNRIAIYIAFFCLVALALVADIKPRRAIVQWLWWGAILWIALVDMTPNDWGSDKRAQDIGVNQARYFADAEFFEKVEGSMNTGAAIFQLPYVAWPESPPVHQVGSYDNARGYLHTKTLKWSFGCIKGRETDEWAKSVSVLAPNAVAPMLDRIARAGFEGLLLDKNGYTPAQAQLLEQNLMKTIAGANPIRHPDGKLIFFDLRRHRDDIRQGRDWETEQYLETHRPTILWLQGFTTHREPGYEWQRRWCGPKGVALFVNPTNEAKTFTCNFRLFTEFKDPSVLTITSPFWNEAMLIDKYAPAITRTFTIPPGRHEVKFECEPPSNHMPSEHRRLTFLISGLKLD